jgi:hypothetical protein
LFLLVILPFLGQQQLNKQPLVDQGAGVCPFGKGEALGCSLPDSINVGRTAPAASGFPLRELVRFGVLVGSERVCLFGGLGVSAITRFGAGAGSGSESD